jgi:hypothetical protein
MEVPNELHDNNDQVSTNNSNSKFDNPSDDDVTGLDEISQFTVKGLFGKFSRSISDVCGIGWPYSDSTNE